MHKNVFIIGVLCLGACLALIGHWFYRYAIAAPDLIQLKRGPGEEQYLGTFLPSGCECVWISAGPQKSDDDLREAVEQAIEARKRLTEKGEFPYRP